MKRSVIVIIVVMLMGRAMLVSGASAEKTKTIKLLPPQTKGGMPLMQALKERKSARLYSSKKLPDQVLSNLLWAAFGVNRTESGKRTAPSAVNWQDVDIYVATEDGLYLYEAKEHVLIQVLDKDIRKDTGSQGFVKDAPVNLVFVSDHSKIKTRTAKEKEFYGAADTAFISQNVYLYCASEGLGTVVRGLVDRKKLSKIMKLDKEQKVTFAQTVGYTE